MKHNSDNTIEYKGYSINVEPDEDAQRPDEWENTDCFLVYDHSDFTVEVKGFNPQDIFDSVEETEKLMYDGYHVFPVYAYIHSGVALSMARDSYPFTDRWDTSFRGFALVQRQKGWSYRRDKARTIAQSLIEEWNDYLSGNVYGYQITDSDGNDKDSCWGYYGDPKKSGLIEDSKANIDSYVEKGRSDHFKQVKIWIKNHVPVMYRKPLASNLAR